MEARAEQKYLVMSPRKLRLVADAVRKMRPVAAVESLTASRKRAAKVLLKVVKQALANAKSGFGVNEEMVVFKEIRVDEGPRYKRMRAGARGMGKPYARRGSHVIVVLYGAEGEKVAGKVKSSPKVVKSGEKLATEEKGAVLARDVEVKMEKEVRQSEVRKIQRRTTHK